MEFPVIEPLRRNGKKILPPNPVELDPDQDGAEIDHLVARGVIKDVRDTSSGDTQASGDGDTKDPSAASGQNQTQTAAQPKKAAARKAPVKKKAAPKSTEKAASEPASAGIGSGDAGTPAAKD